MGDSVEEQIAQTLPVSLNSQHRRVLAARIDAATLAAFQCGSRGDGYTDATEAVLFALRGELDRPTGEG